MKDTRLTQIETWLLGVLGITAIVGAYAYLYFTPLTLIRLVAPLMLVLLLFLPKAEYDKPYFLTIAFYFLYTLHTVVMSVFYCEYISLIDVLNYVLGMSIVIATLTMTYSRPQAIFRFFYKFSLVALSLLIIFAWVERLADWHLKGATCMQVGYTGERLPCGFWANANDFAVVLTFFLLFMLAYAKNVLKKGRWFAALFFIATFATLVMLKCRIAMSVTVLFAIYYYRDSLRRYLKIILPLLLLGGAALLVLFLTKGTSSGTVRLNLYEYALLSIRDSYFLGFGAKMERVYYTWLNNATLFHNDINTHSFLFEMVISSGLFIFILYLLLLCFLEKKIGEKGKNEFYLLLPAYVILLFAPSSSVDLWFHYLFFAVAVGYIPFSKTATIK